MPDSTQGTSHEEVYYSWESTIIPGMKVTHLMTESEEENYSDLQVRSYDLTSSTERYVWTTTSDLIFAVAVAQKVSDLKVIKHTIIRTETLREEELPIDVV